MVEMALCGRKGKEEDEEAVRVEEERTSGWRVEEEEKVTKCAGRNIELHRRNQLLFRGVVIFFDNCR